MRMIVCQTVNGRVGKVDVGLCPARASLPRIGKCHGKRSRRDGYTKADERVLNKALIRGQNQIPCKASMLSVNATLERLSSKVSCAR